MKTGEAIPIWKREPHPALGVLLVVGLVLGVLYIAYLLEFLPVKPQSEFGNRLGQLARQSGGDFSKLSPKDQQYLNDHTSGRGAMALGAYLKSK